jgi:hypothetical protein
MAEDAADYARTDAHAPAHNAAAHAREAVGERGWPFIWRHRKQLAPFAIAFGLLGVSTLGHLVDRGQEWIPLLGFAVVIVLMWRMDRLVERAYAGAIGTAAILWTQTSWEIGIDSLPVLGSWLGITVLAAAIWLKHQQPRSRVEIIGGSIWPWRWQRWHFRGQARKELDKIIEEWPWTAHRAKVPGVTVRKARADIDSSDYELFVDLHGWALIDLNDVRIMMRIASALRALVGLTHVEGEDHEHHAIIRWPRGDSWEPVEDEEMEEVPADDPA